MLAELLKNSFRLFIQDYSVQGHQHQPSAGCPLIYQGFTCSSYCLQKISSQSRKPLRCTLNWLLWGHVWLQEWQFRTLNYWPGDLEKAAIGPLSHWSQPFKQFEDGFAEGCKAPHRIYAADHVVSVALRICSRATFKPWWPSPKRLITMLMRLEKVLEKVAIPRTIPHNNTILL